MAIINAAIKFQLKNDNEWQVMTGRRHCDIYAEMAAENIEYNKKTKIDGFFTDDLQFINREDAIQYAKNCGQIPMNFPRDSLFSEDLW